MKPAFSVIFLTTLIGAGQGLFIALVLGQPYVATTEGSFGFVASVVSLGLLISGLFASFFHLGRPERAWRAVTKWKTSWLSREVIILPCAMMMVFIYGAFQLHQSWAELRGVAVIGWLGIALMLLLYVCTAMIYAGIKFLQEWASPVTVVNFVVLGTASGFLLATAIAGSLQIPQVGWFRLGAVLLTLLGLGTRLFSFYRNGRIKAKSTIQSAIGIKHRQITQRSMGLTGGSFNTKAFFHQCSNTLIGHIRLFVILLVFVLPVALIVVSSFWPRNEIMWTAFLFQYIGLVAERWLFFAEANHPQNLYYQTVS